jgi:hypothetical protein
MRSLITPPDGYAYLHGDWVAQEVAVAAARSRDPRMIADYHSADIYTKFLIGGGLVAAGAAPETLAGTTRHDQNLFP